MLSTYSLQIFFRFIHKVIIYFEGSWFYKLVICCDGKMINVDSCDHKHKLTDNFKRFDDIMYKDQKGTLRKY